MDLDLDLDFGPSTTDVVEVYRSRSVLRSQRWYWRRSAQNGKRLSRSSEGYRSQDHAVRMCLRCNPDRDLARIIIAI